MNEIFVYILLGIFGIWNVILTIIFLKLKKNNCELLKGVDGKNLEQILNLHIERVEKAVQQNVKIEKELSEFKEFSKHFLQKVGFKRFNPFQNTGGDQSFAFAILDNDNNGIVISSMHAREGTRVFAKPVKNGKENKYKFSDEEASVVEKASKI